MKSHRSRRIGAVLLAAAVALPALAMGGQAATSPQVSAGEAQIFTLDPPLSSSSAASSATAVLGKREITIDESGNTLQTGLRSAASERYTVWSQPGRPDPATSDCWLPPAGVEAADWYVSGRRITCENGSHTTTITFDRPVIDPIISIYSAARSYGVVGQDDLSCAIAFEDISIAAINGASPQAYRNDQYVWYPTSTGNGTTSYTWSDYKLSFTHELSNASCDVSAHAHDHPAIQISGTVTSVTLVGQQIGEILVAGSTYPGSGGLGYQEPGVHYGVVLPQVDLAVTKTGPDTVPAGGEIEWSVQVTNNSADTGSHGYTIRDAVPANVTDVTMVSGPDECTVTGNDLVCDVAPAGWTLDTTDPTDPFLTGGDPTADVPVVLAPGASTTPIVLRGTTTGAAGDPVVNTATVAGVDVDLVEENNTSTVTTELVDRPWSVTKSASVASGATYANPGEVITYTIEATNTGDTAIDKVVLTDDLSDILSHSDIVAGSVKLTNGGSTQVLGGVTASNPILTTPEFTLAANSTATLTYQVTVHSDAWSEVLDNTVQASGSVPPATCAVGEDPAEECSTSTPVSAQLEVLKRGTLNGQLVDLDGSAFELLADDNGQPGAVLPTTVTPVTGTTGLLTINGVTPGDYWLRETQAPEGHSLLAQPVRFTLAEDGTVTLTDPAGNTQVTVEGQRLVVTDSPRFAMPVAGSTAGRLLTLAGWSSVAAAAGGAVWYRRRLHRGPVVGV